MLALSSENGFGSPVCTFTHPETLAALRISSPPALHRHQELESPSTVGTAFQYALQEAVIVVDGYSGSGAEMHGAFWAEGACGEYAITTSVLADQYSDEPLRLVAVMCERRYLPTSPETTA